MKNIGFCLLLMLVRFVCFGQISDTVWIKAVTVEELRVIPESVGSSVQEIDTTLYRLLRSTGLTKVLETESFINTRAYSPGGVANFSVRGTGSQHTQVVWEGIPINDPMLGQTDLSTISLSGISNVRVLYGSAGLTNNSGGIGGTIQLVPMEERTTNGVNGRLSGYAGSFGTYGMAFQMSNRYKKVFGSTSVEYQTAKNNFTYRNLASIQQEQKTMEHAAVKRIGFTKTLGVQVNDRNVLKASVYVADVQRQFPPSMLMQSTNEELVDRDLWAALNWVRNGNKSRLWATASYIYGKQEYLDNNDYTFHHLYQANKNIVRYGYELPHNLWLNVGVDVFNETARSDSAYKNEPHWRFWQAAFASLKYVPRRWVSAQVLVREDVIDGGFSPVQGLVGVEVKPAYWVSIKGNVSRNFRAPTLNDLYWVPGGNADLKSETGFSYEAGVGFKFYRRPFRVKLDATYFHSQIDNWIIWLPDGNLWVPQNKRSVRSQGVEAKLDMSFTFGKVLLKLNGAYTYVSSIVKEGASATDASIGKQLIYVSQHQAKGFLSVHVSRLFVLMGHQFTGLRFTTSDNKSSLPAYQLSYLSFGYEHPFGKHALGVNVTIDNLFNTEYQSLAWRPMPGRSFLINLNYQFL